MPTDLVDGPRQLTAAQLRDVQRHLAIAARILAGAPRVLEAGAREVAEQLLPAWHAAHGSAVVTVALLREEPACTPLGAVVSRFVDRFESPQRGAQALGTLLGQLAGHPVSGLCVRKLPATAGGVAQWDCSPP